MGTMASAEALPALEYRQQGVTVLVFGMWAGLGLAVAGAVVMLACEVWDWRVIGGLFAMPLAFCAIRLFLVAFCHAGYMEELTTGQDVDGDGWIGPPPEAQPTKETRLIPVRGVPTIDGINEMDLAEFVVRVCSTNDWTQNTWRGYRFHSGTVCNNSYWQQLRKTGLEKGGFLVGVGKGDKGTLTTRNSQKILHALGIDLEQYRQDLLPATVRTVDQTE